MWNPPCEKFTQNQKNSMIRYTAFEIFKIWKKKGEKKSVSWKPNNFTKFILKLRPWGGEGGYFLFYGGMDILLSSFFLSFLEAQNDPKNTRLPKKIWHFLQPKFVRFLSKNGWFYKILEKLFKKNLLKRKIWVSRARKTGFFFFFLWSNRKI